MTADSTSPQRRRFRSGRDGGRGGVDAARTQAYTRFVQRMKVGLGLAAAGLIAALLIVSGAFDGPEELEITFAEVRTLNDDLRMVSPRIADVDSQGRPYTINAESAVQDADDPALIHLDQVDADMVGDAGASWTAVSSDKGRLNTDEEWVDLEDNVMLFTDEGFEFHGRLVRVDLDSGDISSDEPVSGQGPAGRFEAGGIRVTESGNVINLIDGSKVIIFQSDSGGAPLFGGG